MGLRVLTVDDLGYSHRGGTLVPLLPAHARGAGAACAGHDAAAALGLRTCPEATHERPCTNAHRRRRDTHRRRSGLRAATPTWPIARYQVSRRPKARLTYCDASVPQARDIPLATYHLLLAGDRIDLLAAHYLGDAELHWRVADANLATDMLELMAAAGVRLAIPLPPGTAGA